MTFRIVENTATIGAPSGKETILEIYEKRDEVIRIQGAMTCRNAEGQEYTTVFSSPDDIAEALYLSKVVQLEIDMHLQEHLQIIPTDPVA